MRKRTKAPKQSESTLARNILRFSIGLFLLATATIFLLQFIPWSAPLAMIEIPLHYLPQWLPLLLLTPLLLFWRQALALSKLHLMMVGLAIGYIVFAHMDFGLPLKGSDVARDDASLRILSANLVQVDPDKFSALLRFQKPDVIVTQEIQQPALAALLVDLTSQEPVHSSVGDAAEGGSEGEAPAWRLHCEHRLCLASRYPFSFVEAQSRRFRGAWGVMGAAYDLDVNGEPLRLFNVHLETVRKGLENSRLTRLDFSAMLKNANNRKIEAELLSSWVGQQRPVVVVGDFNMTVGESLYRKYFGGFRNAFSEVGFGLGHTKSTRLLSVRIDHLLSTTDIQPVDAQLGIDVGSDHRPLLVDLALGR